jgi:hypothetical protein
MVSPGRQAFVEFLLDNLVWLLLVVVLAAFSLAIPAGGGLARHSQTSDPAEDGVSGRLGGKVALIVGGRARHRRRHR